MATSRRDITKIKSQLKDLAAQLDDVLETGSDIKDNVAEDMKEQFSEIVSHFQDVTKNAQEAIAKKSKDVNSYAEENPWHVVGIAAAVGILAGVLLSRKNR